MKDSALAGLGFAFEPVAIQPAASSRPAAAGQRHGPPAATATRVAFSLKERRPGPAYGSPEPQDGAQEQQQQQKQNQQNQQQAPARPASAAAAAHHAGGDGGRAAGAPASLALLKLANLRRRAAAQAADALQQQVEERPLLRPPLPTAAPAAAPERAPAAAAAQDEGLLHELESALAGTSLKAGPDLLAQAPPSVHALLQGPVLAAPPDASDAAAAAAGSPACELEQQIAAYRPAVEHPCSTGGADAAAQTTTAPAYTSGAEMPSSSSTSPPETLEEALRCLGLLAARWQGAGAAGAGGGDSPAPAAAPDGAALPHWVRLRAVQVVVAAKQQQAAAGEVLPLVQRLRQVRMHLAFHQVRAALVFACFC